MTRRQQPGSDRDGRKQADRPTKELRKALRKEAAAERRLVDREQDAAEKVERARHRLAEAVEKLAKAQERVSRRADRLSEAESELRLRQRERESGPHRSGRISGYAPESPAQGAAVDLGLIDEDEAASGQATDPAGEDGEPGQGAAVDLGLIDDPERGDDKP
jgi:hypothetical protein